jgi:ribonuclease D
MVKQHEVDGDDIIPCVSNPTLPSPTEPPRWITRPDQLKRMAADLARYPLISVDTESNSLYAYQEQVCLIQFSTGQADYLVDPLVLHDELPYLAPIFANPLIEKIFHAAEYDIICLKRDFELSFSSLFDTMLAARILGRAAVGLASILAEEFNLELDKRYQRANWGQRPLLPALLAYARLDTFYLIPLRERLKTALQECGRWELAQEDFQRLCRTAVPEANYNDLWTRVASGQDLTPAQAAVLEELCKYRDRCAQEADLPAFKVLANQVLAEIAQLSPLTLDDLKAVKGLSPRQLNRHGERLLQAVHRGLNGKPLHRPTNHRPDERILTRLERLRNWRKLAGKNMGVESDVILPRDMMEHLAQAAPTNMEDLAAIMQDLPWRLEHFGPELLSTIKK